MDEKILRKNIQKIYGPFVGGEEQEGEWLGSGWITSMR